MLLGKPEIERYYKSGHITIDPFVPENLGSAQYDVTLGEHFYRERDRGQREPAEATEVAVGMSPLQRKLYRSLSDVYNPFDEDHVRHKWELHQAMTHEEYNERTGRWLKNIGRDEKLIILSPGEIILGHTEEYIGGSCNFITSMMKARSSLGRNGVEVCRCAGMGDVGYFNRWTMEIVNTSQVDTIVLPVRRRVAQLLFFEVKAVEAKDIYDASGKYQTSKSLEELKAAWSPEQMLPKQWKDRECRRVQNTQDDLAIANTTPPARGSCGCDGALDSGCYNCTADWRCQMCGFPLVVSGSVKTCPHCDGMSFTRAEWVKIGYSGRLP